MWEARREERGVNSMYCTYLVVGDFMWIVRAIPVEGRVVFLSGSAGEVDASAGQGAHLGVDG
jgi:hypothetical protein